MKAVVASVLALVAALPKLRADDCTVPDNDVLGGHDVIAYRLLPPGSTAVTGRSSHKTVHAGYTFRFVDVSNKRMFDSDPARFVPAWGGFDAWDVATNLTSNSSFGEAAKTFPDFWAVVDDRLLLFRDCASYNQFTAGDVPSLLAAGDERWDAALAAAAPPEDLLFNTKCMVRDGPGTDSCAAPFGSCFSSSSGLVEGSCVLNPSSLPTREPSRHPSLEPSAAPQAGSTAPSLGPAPRPTLQPLPAPTPWPSATSDCTDKSADGRLNIVLDGVDLVSYHALAAGSPSARGKASHSSEYLGYAFLFVDAENKDLFDDAPERYVPVWGGFDAFAVATDPSLQAGHLGPKSNPDVWALVDGKLHVFLSCDSMNMFFLGVNATRRYGGTETWLAGDLPLLEFRGTTRWGALEADAGQSLFNTACFRDGGTPDDDLGLVECIVPVGTRFSSEPTSQPSVLDTTRFNLVTPSPTVIMDTASECSPGASSSSAALAGTDVVSYRSLGLGAQAVRGNPHHAKAFQGYTFHFVDADNAADFEANPAYYVPAWGGFDAWTVGSGASWDRTKAAVDPNWWAVLNDRLYLFKGCASMEAFLRESDPASGSISGSTRALLEAGNTRWASLEAGLDLFNQICTHDSELDDDDTLAGCTSFESGTHFSGVFASRAPVLTPTSSPTKHPVPHPTPAPTKHPAPNPTVPPMPTLHGALECTDSNSGAAIAGVDVVAYRGLPPGSPAMKGKASHKKVYGGYSFYFVDAENAASFAMNPTYYLPMWGGFDASGIADGVAWAQSTVNVDPDMWAVVNDRVYLFKNCNSMNNFFQGSDPEPGTLSSFSIAMLEEGDVRWAVVEGGNAMVNTICTHVAGDDDALVQACDALAGSHYSAELPGSPTVAPVSRPTGAPVPGPTLAPAARPTPLSTPPPEPTAVPVPAAECASTTLSGAALAGVDVVDYHNLVPGDPATRGKASHKKLYDGYTFYFIDADNAARFQLDPARFLPKWGGFDSTGISEGLPWTESNMRVDPNLWAILNDRVYLFSGCKSMNSFLDGSNPVVGTLSSSTISKIGDGDAQWTTLKGGVTTLNVVCTHVGGNDDDFDGACAFETGTTFDGVASPTALPVRHPTKAPAPRPSPAPAPRPSRHPAPHPTRAPTRRVPTSAPSRAPTKGPVAGVAATPPVPLSTAAPPSIKRKASGASAAASSTILTALVAMGLGTFLLFACYFAQRTGSKRSSLSGDDDLEMYEMPERGQGKRAGKQAGKFAANRRGNGRGTGGDDDDENDDEGSPGREKPRPAPYHDSDPGGGGGGALQGRLPYSHAHMLEGQHVPKKMAHVALNPLDALRADSKGGSRAAQKEDIESVDLLDLTFDGEGVSM